MVTPRRTPTPDEAKETKTSSRAGYVMDMFFGNLGFGVPSADLLPLSVIPAFFLNGASSMSMWGIDLLRYELNQAISKPAKASDVLEIAINLLSKSFASPGRRKQKNKARLLLF